MSNSLWPYGLQHARLPCPSPIPGACSNSCPSSWWCHPASSSSVVPLSSCLQSFPALGSFPMSQFFTSDGQSIRVSASASVLPMNIQEWFPLALTGWISLSPRDSQKSLLQHHSSKTSILQHSAFFLVHRTFYFQWLNEFWYIHTKEHYSVMKGINYWPVQQPDRSQGNHAKCKNS